MKIFYLPTIKVYEKHHEDNSPDTWACIKMNKSTVGQQPQTKPPKDENILLLQPSRCTISHLWSCDHMIQVWTINILVMRSRGQTEKSQNGQKHHRRTAPKDKNQGGQKPQKMKIFYYSNHQGVRYPISGHVIT